MVDDSKNGVKTIEEGEVGDEVQADIHPRHHACLKWNGSSGRLHVAFFEGM